MITLDAALDAAMKLTPDERERLVEILNKRLIQERRKEIANEVKEVTELYNSGHLKPMTADEALDDLHSSLKANEQ
ncbi:MAG TPA: hypothetical protein VIH28_00600 [Ignavibacteriaceae bacterium]